MKALREIRRQRGLSQQGLSQATGIAQNSISEIELGHREPRGSTLRKLAEALDVEIADLFEEPTLPKKAEPLRERPVEPSAGGSSSVHWHPSMQDWEETLESLATLYEQAEEELRVADPGVFPNKVIDVAVLAGHHLRLLSQEADEVRETPGVAAAEERVRRANASVERMIEQFLEPMDEDHAEQSAKFKRAAARGAWASHASVKERKSDDDRARDAAS